MGALATQTLALVHVLQRLWVRDVKLTIHASQLTPAGIMVHVHLY